MDLLRIVVALVTFYQKLCSHAVEAISLSKEEHAKLKRELKSINKPSVKTIKTKHGDIYNCVNIYKQPALNHPLLKNHKVQISPSSALLRNLRASSNKPSSTVNLVKIGFENGSPEAGTVLMQRTSKEELIRTKSHFRRLINVDDDSIKPDGTRYEVFLCDVIY